MGERIIPYNRNEMLLGVFVEAAIRTINQLKEDNIALFDKDSISDLINIKTYLKDENVLNHIECETGLKKVEILKIINKRITNWLENCIEEILDKNNYWVEDALWREVNQRVKYLDAIDGKSFLDSLNLKNTILRICIKYRSIVERFSNEIVEYLIKNTEESVDILLEKYEKQIVDSKNNTYIPKDINPSNEKGQNNISVIVSQFIDETEINDYSRMEKLRLLSISRNLKLNKELKFSAKKKYEELNDNNFEEQQGHVYRFGVKSSWDIDFKEFDKEETTIIFSEKWVKENDDFKTRFVFNTSNFIELMNKGRMNLDQLNNQSSLTDIFYKRGKNEYPINNYISMLQMNVMSLILYEKMLVGNGQTLEFLISKFYNEYLVEEFGYDSFGYIYEDYEMSFRTKAILLLPAFDLTLRKIEYFLQYKSLDIEYLDFDDDTVNYRTIKSAQSIKNIYLNPKRNEFPLIYLHNPSNNLYLNEESLSVYEAVKEGKVMYSELESLNKEIIDDFIEMNSLEISENGMIIFTDNRKTEIYKSLYFDGKIIYYDYDECSRKIIDGDIEAGLLTFDNNFLSKRESDSYSYIMDIKEYNNSLNMRNRYSHKGAVRYNDSEMQHQQNYYTILMLFIQITLKFNIELCLIADLETG
ncbi:hypothetical protein [Erysipelothrix rhusiopathiae]|uniref:hypothetical protein n=1 Tax=Erysipelothrix rhusiopathiae TaxID=1648 RepID=UPI0023B0F39C|nr:hypothetical protein [Erysipelothrix rhusiopathiae]MDE8295625.1 hypothetical protein [Erysipelothrix rhusiopathiae]